MRSIRSFLAMPPTSRLTLCWALLLTVSLFCSGRATAAESVKLSPAVGPPTTNLLASGSGFDPYMAVDIYFDTTDLALATTNGTGAFSNIGIQVPASAVPGTHWVSAVERISVKQRRKHSWCKRIGPSSTGAT